MEERLRKLVGVADAGSYVRAAVRLHVSQPALSVAIAKLERELQAPMFERGVRPLTLTPAGRLAYQAGRDITGRTGELRTALAEQSKHKVTVRLGMIDSVAGVLFETSGSAEMLEKHATVSVVVDNSRNLLKLIASGRLDVALTTGRQRYDAAIELLHACVEPMVVVANPKMARAAGIALQRGNLPNFMSYDQDSATQHVVATALGEAGVTPQTIFYSTSPEVMLKLTLAGKGAAALPLPLVRGHVSAGALEVLGVDRPFIINRPIHVVKQAGVVLPGSLDDVITHICSQIEDVYNDLARVYMAR